MQRSELCRYRRDLSSAYSIAKFSFDTAENEPSKVRDRGSARAADRLEGVLRAGDAGAPDEDGLLGEGGGRHRAGRESQGEEGLGSFKTLAW